ncbi:glyoxylase-like metal-dependent hydrolase (beta-lactamase superfamily II) [Christiangramia gaetbulicola]|uniref:Glyoxylase-like metal-dependent hydrolase (Beta-lactamase superfamily II) n=1 Tax=Christiangramia gaetbulicola TaxID=703340 RepID=A0A2T6AER7_9FLAO|nr:MBL fold metallo-hydrolase [Christiangramia gaetbulicola]PTX42266.1 glyoxylase-like metal-dependent hydrolase (beta-lactamase superfamily II) [Christiangramia gaetbulicola]
MKTTIKALFSFLILSTSSLFAFQDMQDVTIEVIPVNDNVYMLKGAGGNIGVLTGNDGVFMIDDQFALLTEKIKNAIGTISNEPIRFLVNTHHHGDHTGGNTNFKNDGALVMAHENVRKRLNKEGTDPENNGLPILTFNDMMNLHINNNDIVIAHVHNAHTDGDALIYFPQSNVLHTGDTFFNGMFPYIDLESGGSVDGDIKAAETGISLINDNTKIIPGHGAIAKRSDYKAYLNMLKTIRENVQKAIEDGATEDEIIKNEELTSEFFTDQEASEFFINGPKIRGTFYKSLKKQTPD